MNDLKKEMNEAIKYIRKKRLNKTRMFKCKNCMNLNYSPMCPYCFLGMTNINNETK